MFHLSPELANLLPEKCPKWIEPIVIDRLEEHLWHIHFDMLDDQMIENRRDRGVRADLFRVRGLSGCISNLDMNEVWEKIKEIYDDPEKSQFWFSEAIYMSLVIGERFKTVGDAARWKKETISKFLELEERIDEAPVNFNSWVEIYSRDSIRPLWEIARDSKDSDLKEAVRKIGLLMGPHYALYKMREELEGTENDARYFGSHVQNKMASRRYFVRSLTALLIAKTGKPNRRIVANTTSAAFDCDLDKREVIRMSADLPSVTSIRSTRLLLNEKHFDARWSAFKDQVSGGTNLDE